MAILVFSRAVRVHAFCFRALSIFNFGSAMACKGRFACVAVLISGAGASSGLCLCGGALWLLLRPCLGRGSVSFGLLAGRVVFFLL